MKLSGRARLRILKSVDFGEYALVPVVREHAFAIKPWVQVVWFRPAAVQLHRPDGSVETVLVLDRSRTITLGLTMLIIFTGWLIMRFAGRGR